jgi:hypothetical protein
MSDKQTEPGRVSAGIGLVQLITAFAAAVAGFLAASSVEQCGLRALSMTMAALLAALAGYGVLVRAAHPKVFSALVLITFGTLFAVAGWSATSMDQCLPGF